MHGVVMVRFIYISPICFFCRSLLENEQLTFIYTFGYIPDILPNFLPNVCVCVLLWYLKLWAKFPCPLWDDFIEITAPQCDFINQILLNWISSPRNCLPGNQSSFPSVLFGAWIEVILSGLSWSSYRPHLDYSGLSNLSLFAKFECKRGFPYF